jgi:hypothetical protein
LREKLTDWTATTGMIVLIPALIVIMAGAVIGAAPNRTAASCTVDGSVVSAVGLPSDQVINFMVTDGSGTSGWVLGTTWEGTWVVTVPARDGWTKYEFASKTWGKNGSKYNAFASCAVPG